MKTIAIAELKAHLSAEVKKASAGEKIIILDHKRPVAMMAPLQDNLLIAESAAAAYQYRKLAPLIGKDPLAALLEERGET